MENDLASKHRSCSVEPLCVCCCCRCLYIGGLCEVAADPSDDGLGELGEAGELSAEERVAIFGIG